MTTSEPHRSAAGDSLPPNGVGGASALKAIRLKHPWRNTFAVVLVVIFALFVIDAAQRPAYDWPSVGKYLFDSRVSAAALVTLELTVLAMFFAIILGVSLAIMRLSPNPVVKGVAWFYLWIFRGTPVYVQLVFWGLIAIIYKTIDIGLPFSEPWVTFSTNDLIGAFWLAVIGLALNEAAYMAEIVRAGLLSVDKGQEEAATALGMGWFQTMRRVILPQAMRVIIPPTGNEVISMLKTTSLVTAVPLSTELYSRTRDISAETFNPIPLLIVASIWYLAFTSVLMVGQYFLERYFARGVGDRRPDRGTTATGTLPVIGGNQPTVITGAAPVQGADAGDQPIDPGHGGTRS
ncbi:MULTISPECIES: amino acid ABC transporter permease [Microterricola]|uniref:Amino acid ABC transporter membrane protein, PAAT family n=3 Tax=Microterricola TaxID=518733 RepID=A0A1H1L8S4_9MICO|nr:MULTISPECIES: amino acid ABC transporter permease [Microterricola]PPL20437.1 ABC transporter permease [Microterricola pindariensis]SDR70918.1 amino acid ABC transporter membrane protein, PAAT family [Microterricola viridarii]